MFGHMIEQCCIVDRFHYMRDGNTLKMCKGFSEAELRIVAGLGNIQDIAHKI